MSDLDGLSGSALRTKLEEALATISELTQQNSDLQIAALVGRGDLNLVKESDLAGLDPSEMEARAKELQTDRVKEQVDLLMRGGLDEEAAKKVVSGTATTPKTENKSAAEEALTRIKVAGSVGGGSTPPAVPKEGVSGYSAIRQHFADQDSK